MLDELPPIGVEHRVTAARAALAAAGHDALIVSNRSDIRWLTGFGGSNGWAVLTAQALVLVTDGRYADQAAWQLAASSAPGEILVGATQAAIRDHVVSSLSGRRAVAAQSADLSHAEWSALDGRLALHPDGGVLAALRRRKDDAELARIERAAGIAELALADVVGMLASEPTEADIRDELEHRMRRHGADGPSYETIVASGPQQSAHPHHLPNRRRIVEGDSVVIDVGALVDGYHSDMTRTFFVGEPSAEYLERYGAVLESQHAGLSALGPGASSTGIDRACRAALEARRLGEWFVHGTGHGVGLDIHEDPFLRRTGETELAAGEVVTIEPGVYRDGSGGIRVEDLVTVTAGGHRSLTSFRKDSPCWR